MLDRNSQTQPPTHARCQYTRPPVTCSATHSTPPTASACVMPVTSTDDLPTPHKEYSRTGWQHSREVWQDWPLPPVLQQQPTPCRTFCRMETTWWLPTTSTEARSTSSHTPLRHRASQTPSLTCAISRPWRLPYSQTPRLCTQRPSETQTPTLPTSMRWLRLHIATTYHLSSTTHSVLHTSSVR